MLPFDLHVLSMPPAFNLSQDQTLHLKLYVILANYYFLKLALYLDILKINVSAHTNYIYKYIVYVDFTNF